MIRLQLASVLSLCHARRFLRNHLTCLANDANRRKYRDYRVIIIKSFEHNAALRRLNIQRGFVRLNAKQLVPR